MRKQESVAAQSGERKKYRFRFIQSGGFYSTVEGCALSHCEKEIVNAAQKEYVDMDQIRLVSVYRGVPVPSVLFDFTGTKKIAVLASYIIEGIEQGRILVVDELDSSMHFKLTRAIVAMFNNELNTSAQMIFTVHDIDLMDCKKMFRKGKYGLCIKMKVVFTFILWQHLPHSRE